MEPTRILPVPPGTKAVQRRAALRRSHPWAGFSRVHDSARVFAPGNRSSLPQHRPGARQQSHL